MKYSIVTKIKKVYSCKLVISDTLGFQSPAPDLSPPFNHINLKLEQICFKKSKFIRDSQHP